MIDADSGAFMAEFHDLRRIFPLRGDAHELQQIGLLYFKVLRKFPLSAVAAGKAVWVERGKRFPKPAEWRESIPPRPVAATILPLTGQARLDYLRAETLKYEDDPCRCLLCKAAGVDHRFLRFVPDLDEDDRDVRVQIDDRIVTRGHWAHGEELRRWYAARDAFWATADALGLRTKADKAKAAKVPFEQRIERLFAKRPKPGDPPQASGE